MFYVVYISVVRYCVTGDTIEVYSLISGYFGTRHRTVER